MSRNVETDEKYMRECMALARQGSGAVSPNPMVGALLVRANHVIGKGYHRYFGGPHAEVEAIQSAKHSVEGATLYVNLEPCNFFGKTPPCTDLIIRSKIGRVVVGMRDPNPKVSGNGIRQLRRAGIDITSGVLEQECKRQNEIFIKYITKRLPFVTLKIAQTLDAKIGGQAEAPRWITGTSSRKLVHELRAGYDAVLVGAGTVRQDDPKLTIRQVEGRNPVRVILDGNFTTPVDARVYRSAPIRTILFVGEKAAKKESRKVNRLLARGIEVNPLPASKGGIISIPQVLARLGSFGVSSLLVEGGASVFRAFLRDRCFDKLLVFIAPMVYGDGVSSFRSLNRREARALQFFDISARAIDDDILIEAYLQ